MDFVVRYLIFAGITILSLAVSTEKWMKQYPWLIAGYFLLIESVFLV